MAACVETEQKKKKKHVKTVTNPDISFQSWLRGDMTVKRPEKSVGGGSCPFTDNAMNKLPQITSKHHPKSATQHQI